MRGREPGISPEWRSAVPGLRKSCTSRVSPGSSVHERCNPARFVGVSVEIVNREYLRAMKGSDIRWKEVCIVLLAITTAANRFTFSVKGYHIRLETLAVFVVGLGWFISIVRARSRPRLEVADWFLLAWLLTNYIASFQALQARDSLKYATLYALMAMIYLSFPRLCDRPCRLRLALDSLLAVSALVAAYAVIAALAFRYTGANLGVHMNPATGAPTVRGTLWEANVLGSYLAAASLVFLHAMHSPVYLCWRRWLAIGLLLTSCGLVLSMARGAWLGFACALVVAVVFIGRRRVLSGPAVAVLVIAVLGAFPLASGLHAPAVSSSPVDGVPAPASPPAQPQVNPIPVDGVPAPVSSPAQPQVNPILGRLRSLLHLGSDASTFWRARLYAMALAHWRDRFILGWGPGGFRQSFPVIETVDPENIWIASLFVRVLHDTGMLGLGFFLAFVAALGASAWNAWKSGTEPLVQMLLGSMLSCGVAFLVSFQITDAVLLGYPWLYAGILAASTRWATTQKLGEYENRV